MMMAFFFTMRVTPIESTMVTMAGKPSGMAETARDTAVMNIVMISIFSTTPTTKIIAQAMRAVTPRILPSCASFCCRGVAVSFSPLKRFAILPISVFMPVLVTTAVAVPYVTEQPENTMFFLSPSGAFSPTSASASFSEGTDSPVNADSSDFKFTLLISRASAGTKSPASRRMTSPGTSSLAFTSFSVPPRRTRAWGADMFFSASSAFSALLSCATPITAFRMTMSNISAGSINSFAFFSVIAMAKDTIAAMSKMTIITSLNCAKKRAVRLFFFFSASLFSPNFSRRAATSSPSPASGETPSSLSTSSEVLP